MARTVSVRDYQEQIGAVEATPPSMAEQLADLRLETQCDADMPRGEIGGLVRKAADDAGLLADHDEIERETDRIWGSFGYVKADGGPREYSVDVSGAVRDWRRPDSTPDAGPDVGETHHTITDDADPRFSGAGVSDDGGQADLYDVPPDSKFNGRLYRDAPDLADIAEGLIAKHGFLSELINCEIRWFWKRKTGVSKGRVKIGFMKRASDLLGHFAGCDFVGWLSATTARDGKFTTEQVTAAVFHQLCHVGSDENGNWIFQPHDFEGFAAEVRHFGTWTEGLRAGGTAFKAAEQMGLFDLDDDDGIEDDDDDPDDEQRHPLGYGNGAGVLIHATGEPLTEAEIAEMEAAELADDDDDDILADPKVI